MLSVNGRARTAEGDEASEDGTAMCADIESRAPLRVLADQRAVGEALAAALTLRGLVARAEAWDAPTEVGDAAEPHAADEPGDPDSSDQTEGSSTVAVPVAGVICCAVDDGLALADVRAYLTRSLQGWVVVAGVPPDALWGALYAAGACEVVGTGRGVAELVSAVERPSADATRHAALDLFRDWVTSCPVEAGILERLTGMSAAGRAALRRLDHGGTRTSGGETPRDPVAEGTESAGRLSAIERLGVADERAAVAALRALDASSLFEHSLRRGGG
jgi:hypothetical protein